MIPHSERATMRKTQLRTLTVGGLPVLVTGAITVATYGSQACPAFAFMFGFCTALLFATLYTVRRWK